MFSYVYIYVCTFIFLSAPTPLRILIERNPQELYAFFFFISNV